MAGRAHAPAASDERAAQWRRRVAAAAAGRGGGRPGPGGRRWRRNWPARPRRARGGSRSLGMRRESARAGTHGAGPGSRDRADRSAGGVAPVGDRGPLALADDRGARRNVRSEQAATLTREAAAQEQAAAREETRRQRAAQATAVATRVAELAERAGERALADLAAGVRPAATSCARRCRSGSPDYRSCAAAIRELEADVARLTDSVHQDEVARAEQRLRVEQIAETGTVGPRDRHHGAGRGVRAGRAGPAQPGRARRRGGRRRSRRPAVPVRAQGPGAAAAHRRALADPAGGGESAGAGGVRRAGGAAHLPERADRRHQAHQDRSAGHHQGRRRPGGAGLRRGVRRHRSAVRAGLRAAVPGRRGSAGPDRPEGPAGHRGRRRGAPAGQEGQAAVAAVRRRAVADGGGVPDRAVQGAARVRSTCWTRSRPPSTTPTSAGSST